MEELVEDEVLEVMELDDVELEVLELDDVELEVMELDVLELEVVTDVVLLTELEVPRDQESALPISGLTKKWNKGRCLLSHVSKAHEMRKDCPKLWEQRTEEWAFPYLWSWMMKIW